MTAPATPSPPPPPSTHPSHHDPTSSCLPTPLQLPLHCRHDRPSHSLSPKQLTNEICEVHKLISSARQAALTAQHSTAGHTDYPDSEDLSPSAAAAVAGPRTKWFRPGWGWFTPEMVDTAQKLGYHTVLGSVWPWDVYSKWPLLNALYICAKAYPGAVVVLHDRYAGIWGGEGQGSTVINLEVQRVGLGTLSG